MFVERLNFEQIQNIIEVVVPKSQKSRLSIEANLIVNENPSIELLIRDKKLGKYSMYLFDTYLYSSILLNGIEELNKSLIKELYDVFGEEYKEFYLKQVNEVFE